MMAEAAESSTAVKVLVVKVCYRPDFNLKHQAYGWHIKLHDTHEL